MGSKLLIGDIQGPVGPQGDPGPPGDTGVNAVYDGTDYVVQDGAINLVGPTDPGVVADGSIWFDTSG
jgi:hypothetical protein